MDEINIKAAKEWFKTEKSKGYAIGILGDERGFEPRHGWNPLAITKEADAAYLLAYQHYKLSETFGKTILDLQIVRDDLLCEIDRLKEEAEVAK